MNRVSATLLALFCALGGCAEGGSRGSGISTAVEGNVASVQSAALRFPPRAGARERVIALREALAVRSVARAATGLEGIEVTLEGTGFEAETDVDGRFVLRGNFEGDATLVFQRAADGLMARLAINVPAAGTLTLTDIHIDVARAEAAAETQSAQFEGLITELNCGDLTIIMRAVEQNPADLDRYTVRLDTSMLHDARGNALTCGDLRIGQRALVQAEVNADGSFGNGMVEVID
jgi:hypothetical protein